jgi:sulfide:quinone oxidoreductase
MSARVKIVVVGGGFAGLESAFLLRAKLRDRARITLVSNEPKFLFKPNTIYIPFGAEPSSLLIPLARPAAKRDIELVQGSVKEVDPGAQMLTVDGRKLEYDFLVLATGAAMRPEEIPGLSEHAETIWTPDEMLSLRRRLEQLLTAARRGERQTVLFAVPPNNKCAGPLYEIVFMLETWLQRKGVRDRVDIVYTTYERTFIQAFGPKLDTVVREEFATRGIVGETERRLKAVKPNEAVYEDGGKRPFDLLIAFPPYVAAVDYPALESDDRGFLATEADSRRARGQDRIYAPGDAGDFPVKQAFLAFLQADAAAVDIAASVMGTTPKVVFDPVSMCVMEELDKATFAQVPLDVTGDPEQPVRVRANANGTYRVGVSPAWRLGKKLLGVYLPFRFNAGLPFHAGIPWRLMDAGLRGMSGALARR